MKTPPPQTAPVSPLRQKLIDSLTLKGYSPRTVEAYVYAVAGLSKYYQRSPAHLGTEQIQDYLLSLHRGGRLSASTLNVIINGLRYFYREILAQPFGHVERNLPRCRRSTRRPQAFSVAEVERLLERGFLCPKHRVLCMTLYGAGLRLNEALHLRAEHLDPARGLIRVEQGKGRKDRYTLLPQRLLLELRAYWKAYRPQPWLFPSRQNAAQPVGAESVRKTFADALQRAGLPHKGGPHCLRHSFATHLLEAGTPLHVVKRFLGHTSLYTTAGYLHITRATIQAVKSPLDSMSALDRPQP